MTREEEFEILIRIRVLVRITVIALRTGGLPLAPMPLIAAPLSVRSGLPCLNRALSVVERSNPIPADLAGGPLARAAFALSALRTASRAVVVFRPPELVRFLDRLLADLPAALGDVPGPWPSVDDERIDQAHLLG